MTCHAILLPRSIRVRPNFYADHASAAVSYRSGQFFIVPQHKFFFPFRSATSAASIARLRCSRSTISSTTRRFGQSARRIGLCCFRQPVSQRSSSHEFLLRDLCFQVQPRGQGVLAFTTRSSFFVARGSFSASHPRSRNIPPRSSSIHPKGLASSSMASCSSAASPWLNPAARGHSLRFAAYS